MFFKQARHYAISKAFLLLVGGKACLVFLDVHNDYCPLAVEYRAELAEQRHEVGTVSVRRASGCIESQANSVACMHAPSMHHMQFGMKDVCHMRSISSPLVVCLGMLSGQRR